MDYSIWSHLKRLEAETETLLNILMYIQVSEVWKNIITN